MVASDVAATETSRRVTAGDAVVGSRRPAPTQALRFSCAFTRRNCAHDPLFGPQYKRTNRTKGTKIMRCFPHCCPQHLTRSYCGAPVYLQLDLEGTVTAQASPDGSYIDESKLQVFGRFRLEDAPGYAVGHKVSLGVITRSLQSDSNPTGDWVSARMLASAGHNTWLFEVNPSAKWFYDWEVGAARDRRAMTHVFEVYVVYARAIPDQQHHYHLTTLEESSKALFNSVEVVAVATSSPFTLISFRRSASQRGAVEAPESSSPTTTIQQQQQSERIQSRPLSRLPSVENAQNDRVESGRRDRFATEEQEQFDDKDDDLVSFHNEVEVHGGKEMAPFNLPHVLEYSVSRDETMVGIDNSYNNLEEAEDADFEMLPPVAVAAKNLMVVYWILNRVPGAALLPFASVIQESTFASLHEQLDMDIGDGASVAIADGLRHFEDALHLLVDATASSAGPSKVSSFPDAAASSAYQLVEIALRLTLWLLLDKDNNAQMDAFLQRSSKVLLDKSALYQSYQTWVEWLHERIGDFLYDHGWSMDRLISGVVKFGSSSEISGAIGESRRRDEEQLQELLTSDGSDCIAAGQQLFIAQARELFISASRLSPSALQPLKQRVHPMEIQSPLGSLASVAAAATATGRPSSASPLTGMWLWQADTFSVHRVETSSPQCDDSTGGLSFLWFLRQLACVRLTFTTESNNVPVLLIRSIFNPRSVATCGCMKLVLDQHHHWFRCFPGGESTIAAHVGSLSFGDYVASVSSTSGEVVGIRCYAWPTAQTTSSKSGETKHRSFSSSTPAGFAFCWHWQLSLHSHDNTTQQLIARVIVERSANPVVSVQPSSSSESSSRQLDLSTEPLSNKLMLVKSWVPVCEYQLCYRRA